MLLIYLDRGIVIMLLSINMNIQKVTGIDVRRKII